MPVAAFVNKLYYLDEVFGKEAKALNEALQNAAEMQLMAFLADRLPASLFKSPAKFY